MPPAKQIRAQTVRKKILFYRVNVGIQESGSLIPFDPAVLSRLNRLPFSQDGGRYLSEQDGNALCVWVDGAHPICQLRFGRIRRTGLPQIERQGALQELAIAPDAGLSEPIHAVFFESNVVGADYNFYGPRLSRLAHYLRLILPDFISTVAFEPLLRPDVMAQVERLRDVRLFELKLRSAYFELAREADQDLGSTFEAANRLGATEQIQIVLKLDRQSQSAMLGRILKMIRNLTRRPELSEAASRFVISGTDAETGKVEPIDLLHSQLLQHRYVAKVSDRSRALEPVSVFAEIVRAHESLRSQIDIAASIAE